MINNYYLGKEGYLLFPQYNDNIDHPYCDALSEFSHWKSEQPFVIKEGDFTKWLEDKNNHRSSDLIQEIRYFLVHIGFSFGVYNLDKDTITLLRHEHCIYWWCDKLNNLIEK